MNEITEELIKQEMQKMIGGALTTMEWFLVFSFLDMAMNKDEMFASKEDMEALMKTVKRLHDQVFPPAKEAIVELEEKLAVKPKKIFTKPDLIL